ncbi:MAG: hypothetical protein WDO70_05465 [Alphaproteobacteria bacterium]
MSIYSRLGKGIAGGFALLGLQACAQITPPIQSPKAERDTVLATVNRLQASDNKETNTQCSVITETTQWIKDWSSTELAVSPSQYTRQEARSIAIDSMAHPSSSTEVHANVSCGTNIPKPIRATEVRQTKFATLDR